MKSSADVKSLTLTAICTALLCACSYIVFPFSVSGAVLSLHTVIVNITALILSPKNSAKAVGLYVLMGALGLPVFASGTSGAAKLFGPTGGFYFGFFIAAAVMSILRVKLGKESLLKYLLVTLAAGLPIMHISAVAFMYLNNGHDIRSAFLTISAPFLAVDALKCVFSAYAGIKINKALNKHGLNTIK